MAIGAGAWPLAAIPGGIVVANLLVILAVRGQRKPAYVAFVVLAGLDLLIGTLMLVVLAANAGVAFDGTFPIGVMAVAGAIMLKGILTVLVAVRLWRRDTAAVADREPRGLN